MMGHQNAMATRALLLLLAMLRPTLPIVPTVLIAVPMEAMCFSTPGRQLLTIRVCTRILSSRILIGKAV